jgi:hypothetical protein
LPGSGGGGNELNHFFLPCRHQIDPLRLVGGGRKKSCYGKSCSRPGGRPCPGWGGKSLCHLWGRPSRAPLRGQGKPSPYVSLRLRRPAEHFLLRRGLHSPISLSTVWVGRMRRFVEPNGARRGPAPLAPTSRVAAPPPCGTFSPAARPTLPHIVIGSLGQEDEKICGAERNSARASAAGPYVSGCGSAALGYISPAARPTLPLIVIGNLGQEDEEICGAGQRSARASAAGPYLSGCGSAAPGANFLLPRGLHSPLSLSTVWVKRMKRFVGPNAIRPYNGSRMPNPVSRAPCPVSRFPSP